MKSMLTALYLCTIGCAASAQAANCASSSVFLAVVQAEDTQATMIWEGLSADETFLTQIWESEIRGEWIRVEVLPLQQQICIVDGGKLRGTTY